jgi:hypothetical protein
MPIGSGFCFSTYAVKILEGSDLFTFLLSYTLSFFIQSRSSSSLRTLTEKTGFVQFSVAQFHTYSYTVAHENQERVR